VERFKGKIQVVGPDLGGPRFGRGQVIDVDPDPDPEPPDTKDEVGTKTPRLK
jgi:hypothetical protein